MPTTELQNIEPELNILVSKLSDRVLTVACAESCTGGMVGAYITSVSGSSRMFKGGCIAYANEIKTKILGVPDSVIQSYGAVSEEVARLMATGVRDAFNSDIGLATTGVAGPNGGTLAKPVGTVWLALVFKEYSETKLLRLNGNRADIRTQASIELIRMVLKCIDSKI